MILEDMGYTYKIGHFMGHSVLSSNVSPGHASMITQLKVWFSHHRTGQDYSIEISFLDAYPKGTNLRFNPCR